MKIIFTINTSGCSSNIIVCFVFTYLTFMTGHFHNNSASWSLDSSAVPIQLLCIISCIDANYKLVIIAFIIELLPIY